MKRILLPLLLLLAVSVQAAERQPVWPKGKMPHASDSQIAAMTDEARQPDFKPEKHRMPYLEWFDAPEHPNGTCMILISGGSYKNCCDGKLIRKWNKELTAQGVQCVNFVYRTPRPEGLPYYQTAWEDGQRAVRLVRSQAKKRGFDPERIGVMGMSAGGHLSLLLATSSCTETYQKIDALDDIPCHINLAVVNAPAYATTDADQLGIPATREGYGPDVTLSPVFQFDAKTCPVSLHHGGADIYSPNGSTLIYRKLREMEIPAELHLYPGKGHGAYGFERAVEFMRQMGFMEPLQPEEKLVDRFTRDLDSLITFQQPLWPEGKTPDLQEGQGDPYIKWFIPAERKTDAIQIIYSGGGYDHSRPDNHEVTPARRYLNEKGVTVVVLHYRAPRPAAPLAKHTTAWQDLQRAIRLVRSQAAEHGLNPDKIGIMGSSAGGHLTLMGAVSSLHNSYRPIDEIDKLPCNVQWGIAIYPAYVIDDNGALVPELSFDLNSCPLLLLHGDADIYPALGSVTIWEKMRSMGIQCELHTLATRGHCFQRNASPGTGSYNYLERIAEYCLTAGNR
ncbi:MAG: alpha/beta hydrolase [Bacteroidales bacterium]|nr:alpha/beta hydrolase [Bacteroidales bacterium]